MALHGEIEVNGETVGRWSAQRVLTRESGYHTYRWEAYDSTGRHVTGDLIHDYSAGAMTLAAHVLKDAVAALSRGDQGHPRRRP